MRGENEYTTEYSLYIVEQKQSLLAFVYSAKSSGAKNATLPQFLLLDETKFGHVGFGVGRVDGFHRNVSGHST